MDNLTHSLIGATIAELVHQACPPLATPEASRKRRRLFYVTSVLASNFPDLDLLYSNRILDPPLGYILHHRGHTHTLLGTLPQLLLLMLAIYLFSKILKLRELPKGSWIQASWLGLFALGLHIFADSFNSYGVHPFYPFNNQWYYGDSVFIVEPFLWAMLGSGLALGSARRWLQRLWFIFIFSFPVLAWALGLLHPYSVLFVAFAALTNLLLLRKSSLTKRIATCALIAFSFVGSQFLISISLKSELKATLEAANEQAKVYDLTFSPLPANPLCWTFFSVETAGDTYIARQGIMSAAPSIVPGWQCPTIRGSVLEKSPVQFQKQVEVSQDRLLWHGEFRYSRSAMAELYANNCHVNAWFRFIRVFHVESNIVNDLRFAGRGAKGSFSALDLEAIKNQACPELKRVPPWLAPLAELLRP